MNSLLKNFLAALLGIVLYQAIKFVLGPDEFDFAQAALDTVIVAVLVTATLTFLSRRRAKQESSAS